MFKSSSRAAMADWIARQSNDSAHALETHLCSAIRLPSEDVDKTQLYVWW